MRARRVIRAAIALVCLSAAAVFAWELSHGSANLANVKARVVPRLKAEMTASGFAYGQPIFIRVFKEARELELWVRSGDTFALFRTYPICTYSGDLGPKTLQPILESGCFP